MISARTTAALAAAKDRGTTLGGPSWKLAGVGAAGRVEGTLARQEKAEGRAGDLAPILAAMKAEGVSSLRGLAEGLTSRCIPTACGGSWSAVPVQRLPFTLA